MLRAFQILADWYKSLGDHKQEMEWATQKVRGAESSCRLGEYDEASESEFQMQITEKGFDESSDSVDPKEVKKGEDRFYGAGHSNDSSGNIKVSN